MAGLLACLNTRLDVIKVITDWIQRRRPKPVLWLFRANKACDSSTISTRQIADMYRDRRRLGAFIFFNRDVKDRSDPSLVIRTLAYKLASFDARVGDAVSVAIQNIPDIAESPLHFQFRNLVVQPLSCAESREYHPSSSSTALDECGTSASSKILLSILSQEIANLPSFTRILITSRPEDDIKRILYSHMSVRAQELDITSDSTEHDIETFIQNEMAGIRETNDAPTQDQIGQEQKKVSALTKRATGLFV